jgi:hypothetical protein
LRQLSNGQFHGAADGDASNAFGLIDPRVRRQLLLGFVAQGFQFFHALLRARLFVITSTRRGTNYREYDYAEQRKEKHNRQPRGE